MRMPIMEVSVLTLFCIGGIAAMRISSGKTPPSPVEWQQEVTRSAGAFISSAMQECGLVPWGAQASAARSIHVVSCSDHTKMARIS